MFYHVLERHGCEEREIGPPCQDFEIQRRWALYLKFKYPAETILLKDSSGIYHLLTSTPSEREMMQRCVEEEKAVAELMFSFDR